VLTEAVKSKKPSHGNGSNEPTVAFPINYYDEVIGILGFSGQETIDLHDEDLAEVETIVEQVGLALENQRLFDQTQMALAQTEEQAHRLSRLNELSTELSQTADEDQVFRIVARHTPQIIDADQVSVALLIEQGNEIEVYALDGMSDAILAGTRLPLAGTDVGKAIREQRVLINSDTSESKSIDTQQLNKQGILATIVVPLMTGGRVIGTLNVGSKKANAYGAGEQDLLQQIATLMASALESRRLFEQTQASLSEAEMLFHISARLNAATTLEEALKAAIEPGMATGASYASLFKIDVNDNGKPEWLEVVATWQREGEPALPVGSRFFLPDYPGGSLWTETPDEPMVINDTTTDERLDQAARGLYQQMQVRSTVTLPLVVGGNWVGGVNVTWPTAQNFSADQHRLYKSIAAQASTAINNQLLFEQTQIALARAEAVQRQYTVQAWETYRNKNRNLAYEQVRTGVKPLGASLPAEVAQVMADNKTVITGLVRAARSPSPADNEPVEANSKLLVPLRIQDEIIGILGLEDTETARQWTPEEVALVETIVAQMVEAAENLRLVEETQQRAAREARVNEIGDKIQAAQSLEEALQVVVKEIGLSLKASQTAVELSVADEKST
jgi:GAF domain-containing protein